MTIRSTGYQPLPLSTWLGGLQAAIRASAGADTQVSDQRYVLARLLLVFAEELARQDAGFFLALAQLDPEQAEGVWLSLIAMRLGAPRLAGSPSLGIVIVLGTVGVTFTGSEECEDSTTGLRWRVGPGTIGPTGSAALPAVCLADGPTLFSDDATDWQIRTDMPAWVSVRGSALTELGRVAESDDDLRARLRTLRGARPATEPGVITALRQVSGAGLLGFVTNRSGTTDDNGIPGHHMEAVLDDPPAPAAVGAALYGAASATAGTHGNRTVTVEGAFGPVTWRYSVGTDLRVFARIAADTSGAPGAVPADLAAQLAAALEAWGAALGAHEVPTANVAEAYLTAVIAPAGTLSPVTDLEVEFSLDAVTWGSSVPVLLRERPRISNNPSAAVVRGSVPGPYSFSAADAIELGTGANPLTTIPFAGTETDLADVIALIGGGGVAGLAVDSYGDGASAVIELRTTAEGATASLTIGAATSANVLTALGLPAVPYTVTGRNTDIEVTVT